MWINPQFRPDDSETALRDVIAQNPLATIVTGDPVAVTHMPLLLRESPSGGHVLVGHVPLVDPSSANLADGNPAVAVFRGPAAYVTPNWYHSAGLPTYNFLVVHAHGRARRLDEAALRAHLLELIHHEESAHAYSGECEWTMNPESTARMETLLPKIVGFEIAVDQLYVKTKLGQNRSTEDNATVMAGLRERNEGNDRSVADRMQNGLAH